MKKKSFSYIALFIVFVLFHIIAFAVPTDKTATFWIAYGFTVLAFALQIPIWKIAFGKSETIKSKFLGIPILSVGLLYLSVQLIAFILFLLFPMLPEWIAIILCTLILGSAGLCVITGEAGKDEINRIESRIQSKGFYLKALQVDIELLIEQETDATTKAELQQLSKEIRFSDPMSHEALQDLESNICSKVEALKTAVDKKAIINELHLLLRERTMKCKILK